MDGPVIRDGLAREGGHGQNLSIRVLPDGSNKRHDANALGEWGELDRDGNRLASRVSLVRDGEGVHDL